MEQVAQAPELPVFPPEWQEEIDKDPHFPENVMLMQVTLARLGYFKRPFVPELDERTVQAFREYKRDAGLPEGEAIFDQALAKRMNEDMEGLTVPISTWPFSFQDFGDWVDVRGSWTGVGTKVGHPQQTSEIKCMRSRGVCFETLAKVTDDHGLLSSMAVIHEVDQWNDTEITTIGDRASCAYWTIRINRVTKSVSKSRVITSTEGTCADLKDDFHLKMVSGQDVWRGLFGDFEERQRKILDLPRIPE